MDPLVLDIQEHTINNRLLYLVQVIHQEHKCQDFNRSHGCGRDTFVASNGFELMSTGYPMLYHTNGYMEPLTVKSKYVMGASTSHTNRMCVRGSAIYSDDNIVYIDSPLYIEQLKQAVKEYNIARG